MDFSFLVLWSVSDTGIACLLEEFQDIKFAGGLYEKWGKEYVDFILSMFISSLACAFCLNGFVSFQNC